MALKQTLKFRIIEGMAFFTILLIVVFTSIILLREKELITQNNLYRARVGTFAAKEALERSLLSSARAGSPAKVFQKLIPILLEGQLVEDAAVTDLKAKVAASTDSGLIGTKLSDEEALAVRSSVRSYSPKSWFQTRLEPGQAAFYIPLAIDDVPQYVAVLRYSLGDMAQAIRRVGKLCAFSALAVIAIVIPVCLLLIRAILGPIQILNRATKDVAAGNLGLKVEVPTEDELGELAQTFNGMTAALVKMKERAENANPLTKLPGNNVIHEEIEKRIRGNLKFVAIYSDLDNFKAFNDKYGIAAGDQAIKLTAQVMREALRQGDPNGFLGHEGGDDFILLTTPEKREAVTQYLCAEFDKRIKELYSPEDRAQGHIVSKDREGNVKQFPLMTFSLAGVTNAYRPLNSYAEVTNICAEVKKKAKLSSKAEGKSSFVMDERTADHGVEARKEANPPEPTG
ncbi:MAG: HAMP domain-containing protein [Candidatus Omnitrophica bacterium]|nr:HAMP domain-containing protein [Candidatus Omnitrophota bacterium]